MLQVIVGFLWTMILRSFFLEICQILEQINRVQLSTWLEELLEIVLKLIILVHMHHGTFQILFVALP